MISLRHLEEALAGLIPIFAPLIILSRKVQGALGLGLSNTCFRPMIPMVPMVFSF